MRLLFDGDAHVSYAQIYVHSGWEGFEDPFIGNFKGQVNGLCGGAEPGHLYMITGLHTGHVGFRVELHDEAPSIDDSWEEVVEVSFTPTSEIVALTEWGGESWPLDLEQVGYRVRYSASGMDEARQVDTRLPHEPIVDRYLLQFWPAPPGADRVMKQTSAIAAYWHDWARQLPPPPTPEEVAEAERRRAEAQRQEQLEAEERMRRAEDDLYWGGVRPSERIRNLPANVIGLAKLDRPLLDALAEAGPDTQRSIARWAARRAYEVAGLSTLDWVAPALAALERGEELPAPFDDPITVWGLLYGKSQIRAVHVRVDVHAGADEVPSNIDPRAAALPAIFAAVEDDPLKAAVDAIHSAVITFQEHRRQFLTELRVAFPAVG